MMTVTEEAEKYFDVAVECYENNDIERAKKYFTKAIDGYSKVIESGVNEGGIYRKRGFAYLCIKDYIKAIEDFTKAIELGINNNDVYVGRGFSYLYIKDYPKAIEDCTKVIELDENNKDTYDGRGRAYMCIKNYPKAVEDFTKAIELGVNNKDVYNSRGRAYACIGDYTRAVEDFTRAIELGADDKDVYSSRGFAYMYIKGYAKAIEDLTKAIELGANDKDVYNSRGIAYRCIENYARAIEDFTKAIELGGNDKAIYNSRGHAYIGMADYPKAIEDFTKAIRLGANNEVIYGNRGFAYLGIKGYTKAIDDFTKAIKVDAKNKYFYGNRAIAYIGMENYTQAIIDCTKAIKLDKNDKDIYKILGIAHIGAKQYPEAEENFKKVIELNKNNRKNKEDRRNISNRIKLTDNIFNLITDILKKNKSNVLPDEESINLIKLVSLCYYLMEEIRINPSDVEEEKFVHYTKASTVQYLLKKDHSAQLRLNNAVYMNDPEEGQILKKVLCQLDQNNELENLLKDTEDIKNYTYLTCFSPYDKRDELPMWIHYGDGGKGVGLVFHNSFFKGTDLYKVQYIDVKNFDIGKLDRKVRKKIRIILNLLRKDEVKNNTNKEFKDYVNIILNYVSYLFKDKAYEYENEVRILNYKDYDSQDIKTDDAGRDIPRLFIEYKQCITDKNCVEVIAGPKAQYTEIAAYAKYVGIQKVSQSEIKYR